MLDKNVAIGMILGLSALSFTPAANANYYDDEGQDDYYGNYDRSYDRSYDDSSRTVSRRSHRGHERYSSSHPPLPSKISSGNVIKVDLGRLAWGAYDDQGNLIRWGRASGGKKYCPDIRRGCRTVTGTYTIFSKKGPGCKSSRFPVGRGGAPMPYCMHFKGGYALHGSNAVPGYNASHGCVRVPVHDAQWLNQNFVRTGSTRISITY